MKKRLITVLLAICLLLSLMPTALASGSETSGEPTPEPVVEPSVEPEPVPSAEPVAESEPASDEQETPVVMALDGEGTVLSGLSLPESSVPYEYYERCDGTDRGTYYEYDVMDALIGATVVFQYSDGQPVARALTEGDFRYETQIFEVVTDQSTASWSLGNNTITIQYIGSDITLDIPVKVIANPVTRIEIATPEAQRYALTDADIYDSGTLTNGTPFALYDVENFIKSLTLRVVKSDGTSDTLDLSQAVGDFYSAYYAIGGHKLTASTNQPTVTSSGGGPGPSGRPSGPPTFSTTDPDALWSADKTNQNRTITLTYLGCEVTAENVALTTSPIDSIAVLDGNGFYYIEGMDCATVTKPDGSKVYSYYPECLLSQLTLAVYYKEGKAPVGVTLETDEEGKKYYKWVVRESGMELDGEPLLLHDSMDDATSKNYGISGMELTLEGNAKFVSYGHKAVIVPVVLKSQAEALKDSNVAVQSITIVPAQSEYHFWYGVHEQYPYGTQVTVTRKNGQSVNFTLDETTVWSLNQESEHDSGALIPALGHRIDLDMEYAFNRSCQGRVSYMGQESNPFSYRLLGSENIVAEVCINPYAPDAEKAFALVYDNGMFYTFSMSRAQRMTGEKELATYQMVQSQPAMATYSCYRDTSSGSLAYYVLYESRNTQEQLYRLWLDCPASWKHSLLSRYGTPEQPYQFLAKPQLVFSRGILTSLLTLNGVAYGSVGGEYIAPTDGVDPNENTTVADDCVTVTVKSDQAATASSVSISTTATSSLKKTDKDVVIETDVAKVRFDAATMDELAEANENILFLGVACENEIPADMNVPVEEGAVLDVSVSDSEDNTLLGDDGSARQIELTMPIPKELEGETPLYVYYYRETDGKLIRVPAEIGEDGLLHIQTSHFSRYVITAAAVASETPAPTATPAPSEAPAAASGQKGETAVKTGDEAVPVLWLTLAVYSVVGMAALYSRKRKSEE